MNRLDHCPLCQQKIGTLHQHGCRLYQLNLTHPVRNDAYRDAKPPTGKRDPNDVSGLYRTVYDVDCELTPCQCSAVLVREYRRGGHRGFYSGSSGYYPGDTVCPRATWIIPLDPPADADQETGIVWTALYQIPAGYDTSVHLAGIAVVVDPHHDVLTATGPFPTWNDAALWLDVLGCLTPRTGVEPKGPVPYCLPLSYPGATLLTPGAFTQARRAAEQAR